MIMDKEKILSDYIDFKKLSISDKGKLKDTENYARAFIQSSKKDFSSFTESDLISFLNVIGKKYKVSSMNGIKALLKNLIKWYFTDWSSKFRNLDKICSSQKTTETYSSNQMLSKEDIEKLVQYETSPLWKAYWLTLFYGGFRPVEVCRLKWKELEFDKEGGAFIDFVCTKTKKRFCKYLNKEVVFYINQLKNNGSEYIFTSPVNKGEPIAKKSVNFRLNITSVKALGKKINPYILRHSIATILYNDDKNKESDVANQMGHNKNMKEKYSHLDKEKIREKSKGLFINPELTQEENDRIEKLENTIKEIRKIFCEGMESLSIFYSGDKELSKTFKNFSERARGKSVTTQ